LGWKPSALRINREIGEDREALKKSLEIQGEGQTVLGNAVPK
jgi:hypothetical protein